MLLCPAQAGFSRIAVLPSSSAGNVPGAYNGGVVCVCCQFRPCSAYDTTPPLSIRDRYAFEFQARPPGFDGNLCDTLLIATISRLTFMPRSREGPELKIPLVDSVRRNHAIEHATVTLMLERGMRVPMGGYSISPGFIIWSRASPEDVPLRPATLWTCSRRAIPNWRSPHTVAPTSFRLCGGRSRREDFRGLE